MPPGHGQARSKRSLRREKKAKKRRNCATRLELAAIMSSFDELLRKNDRYSQEFLRFNQKGYLSVVSGDYNRLNLIQRQFNPLTPKSD